MSIARDYLLKYKECLSVFAYIDRLAGHVVEIKFKKEIMVMNRLMVFALMALLFPALGFAADKDKPAAELKTFQDKLSYSMGLDVGTYFKGMKEDINYDRLIQGINDSYKGNKQLVTPEEVAQVQKEFATKMQAKQAAQLKEMQEKNKKIGEIGRASCRERV